MPILWPSISMRKGGPGSGRYPAGSGQPLGTMYAKASNETYRVEIRSIPAPVLEKHFQDLRKRGFTDEQIKRNPPKGQMWIYKKGVKEPVEGPFWMDQTEPNYPNNYNTLPLKERAALEAKEQIDKWAERDYETRAKEIK